MPENKLPKIWGISVEIGNDDPIRIFSHGVPYHYSIQLDNVPKGCYCSEDQGAGYTYESEHGDCDVCIEEKLKIVNSLIKEVLRQLSCK